MQYPLELGEVLRSEGDFVLEGFLVCSRAQCRFKYPVLAGVPIVLKDMKGWWRSERSKLTRVTGDAAEMRKYFEDLNLNEVQYHAERNLVSSYMDLHYGGLDDAPASFGSLADPRPFWQTVVEMAQPEPETRYERSLDLGCSVGRYTFELARLSDLAIGMDMNFKAASSAAMFQQSQEVSYERRRHGRYFEEMRSSYVPPQNVFFLVGDALDPPFGAECFDLVAGLNLVDNVKLPLVLIGQMDALLRAGGILILGAPYEWRHDICEPSEWLESEEFDAPVIVQKIIEGSMFPQMGLKYEVSQGLSDVPWTLRHHDRHWSMFLVHLLKARKKARATKY